MVRKIAYRVIIFCLLIIIGLSLYQLGKAFLKYYTARAEFNKISEIALVDPDHFTGEINWDKLRKINPDIVGWIYLKDTNINYPVVKGDDNKTYLTRAYNGDWSGAGTPFVDYRCENEFEDFNTIIYGHHMRDGSMFNNLSKYFRDKDFYKSHKNFELITPNEKYHLKVFSGFLTKADSYVYDLNLFEEEQMDEFINKVQSSNSISGMDDVIVTPLDKVVTLSTCAYDFEDAREVVFGKLVKWSDEEKEEALRIQKQLDEANKK